MKKIIIQIILVFLIYGIYGILINKLDLPMWVTRTRSSIIVYLILACIFIIGNKKLLFRVPKSLYAFTFVAILSSLINISSIDLLQAIKCSVAPLISFQLGTICANLSQNAIKGEKIFVIHWGFMVLSLICLKELFMSPMYLSQHRDFIFSIIFFTPFFFIVPKKWTLFFSVILFILVLASIKRSAVIGVVSFFAIYYGITLSSSKITFKKRIIGILGILIAVIIGYLYFENSIYSEELTTRFSNLADDGGSGRDEIYSLLFYNIITSDIISLLFGNGFDAVKSLNGYPAHNDLLEIVYDFGIIALIIWITFLFSIVRKSINYFKKKDYDSTAILLATFTLWQICSEMNCIIVNPCYMALIFLSLGLCNKKTSTNEKQVP